MSLYWNLGNILRYCLKVDIKNKTKILQKKVFFITAKRYYLNIVLKNLAVLYHAPSLLE